MFNNELADRKIRLKRRYVEPSEQKHAPLVYIEKNCDRFILLITLRLALTFQLIIRYALLKHCKQ